MTPLQCLEPASDCAPRPGSDAAPAETWSVVRAEGTENRIAFNVMPGKEVSETLFVREYRIAKRRIEADFDRAYSSSMEKSPSHLIFLTTLIHAQKLLYALLCHEFGFAYNPNGRELMKIWPYEFAIRLPRMIRDEEGLTQSLEITELRAVNRGIYDVRVLTVVSGSTFDIRSKVYVSEERTDAVLRS